MLLSVRAVGPMGASVDAPGSVLKYNTGGFYVDFRTYVMNPFPSNPDAVFAFTLKNYKIATIL